MSCSLVMTKKLIYLLHTVADAVMAFPLVVPKAFPHALKFCYKFCSLVCVPISVTRCGDLLDFGQLFKAFGNN